MVTMESKEGRSREPRDMFKTPAALTVQAAAVDGAGGEVPQKKGVGCVSSRQVPAVPGYLPSGAEQDFFGAGELELSPF
jgi:hypothetical protein